MFYRSGPAQNRQNHTFWPTGLKHKGTNEDTHNQKTTYSMVSGSSATNPMEKAAMFRRTKFLHFTGPDLRKIGKNHTFLAHKGDKQRHPQSKNHLHYGE